MVKIRRFDHIEQSQRVPIAGQIGAQKYVVTIVHIFRASSTLVISELKNRRFPSTVAHDTLGCQKYGLAHHIDHVLQAQWAPILG